jgi:hypothetical protein
MTHKKWSVIRWVLRSIASIAGVLAGASISPAITTICAAVAGAAGGISVDLPRDPWPKERREKK